MKLSNLNLITLKNKPSDAEIVSHQLMLRSGMIKKLASGLYTWMPLGYKVLKKIEIIIAKEMDKIGFPCLDKEFFPHITLARVKYPQKHTPDISMFLKSSYDPIDFPADRVQFLSSELLPSGTFYTLLGSFPLGESL